MHTIYYIGIWGARADNSGEDEYIYHNGGGYKKYYFDPTLNAVFEYIIQNHYRIPSYKVARKEIFTLFLRSILYEFLIFQCDRVTCENDSIKNVTIELNEKSKLN